MTEDGKEVEHPDVRLSRRDLFKFLRAAGLVTAAATPVGVALGLKSQEGVEILKRIFLPSFPSEDEQRRLIEEELKTGDLSSRTKEAFEIFFRQQSALQLKKTLEFMQKEGDNLPDLYRSAKSLANFPDKEKSWEIKHLLPSEWEFIFIQKENPGSLMGVLVLPEGESLKYLLYIDALQFSNESLPLTKGAVEVYRAFLFLQTLSGYLSEYASKTGLQGGDLLQAFKNDPNWEKQMARLAARAWLETMKLLALLESQGKLPPEYLPILQKYYQCQKTDFLSCWYSFPKNEEIPSSPSPHPAGKLIFQAALPSKVNI